MVYQQTYLTGAPGWNRRFLVDATHSIAACYDLAREASTDRPPESEQLQWNHRHVPDIHCRDDVKRTRTLPRGQSRWGSGCSG